MHYNVTIGTLARRFLAFATLGLSGCVAFAANVVYVYNYGSITLSRQNIVRYPKALYSLAEELAHRPSPLSMYIRDAFDHDDLQKLNIYLNTAAKTDSPTPVEIDRQFERAAIESGFGDALVHILDQIISGSCIYNKVSFRDVAISAAAKRLLRFHPTKEDLRTLNWLLLCDAYSELTRGAVDAEGDRRGVFRRIEEINVIEIYPSRLSDDAQRDIWVTLSGAKAIPLIDIKQNVVELMASGVSTNSISPRIGSRSRGISLTIPCSLGDYEKIFGRPDEIQRRTVM